MNVTIATIVKNEADRFLPDALECWTAVSDRVVAVDNGSTDATLDILSAFGAEVHHFEPPMDGNEAEARAFLWQKAVQGADWVVHLDADQVVAADFRPHLTGDRVAFPVFDMWSPTEYRSDRWWKVRPWWTALRVKNKADQPWKWPDRGWHSGHVPQNLDMFGPPSAIPHTCGVLHYGYATPELRERHFDAYMARRDVLTPLELMHARTILDEDPDVVKLPFEPRWRLL